MRFVKPSAAPGATQKGRGFERERKKMVGAQLIQAALCALTVYIR